MMNSSKSEKFKIISMVSHNLNLEGAPWSLFFLAKWLRDSGHDIKIISPKDGPLRKFYEEAGIAVTIYNFMNNKVPEKYLKNSDIFFVNTILGFKFIKNLNLNLDKVIWCIRESEREVYFNEYPDLKDDFFKKVSKVVFVSAKTQEIYDDLNNGNFCVIYNGLDLDKIDSFINKNSRKALRIKHLFSKKDFIISIIGTVCLRKGQLEFVEAAINLLKKTSNKNIKFLIVGGRGDQYEMRIRKIINDSDFRNNFFIIHETPDVYEYFMISDIFVCNSYIESFPRVILEAMAFKLPIIATDVYGISEQITSGREGILISAGDIVGLSKAMNTILLDKKLATNLSINARRRLKTEFNHKCMVDKYNNLIEKLCAE